MEFVQPTADESSDKVKAELARVERARNNVTILESEAQRLKELIASETYTVEQLVKRRADLIQQIPLFEADVKKLDEQKGALESDIRSLEARQSQLQSEVAQQSKNLSERTVVVVERERINVAESEALKSVRAELDAKITAHEEKERKMKEKEEALKALIS